MTHSSNSLPPIVLQTHVRMDVHIKVLQAGYIDNVLFMNWLHNHFIKYAVASRPLLLLLDDHSSHYELGTLKFVKANDVIIFCLPPHTSYGSQPL